MNEEPKPGIDALAVAFLDIAPFEDGEAIRGGCLLTDAQTRPLEFRESGLIKPTPLQRVLYGKTLHEYILTELVGIPLLQALETQPDMVLVRDAVFLDLKARLGIPIYWVHPGEGGQIELRSEPAAEGEWSGEQPPLPEPLEGKGVLEPFARVRKALEEAHRLGVGEMAQDAGG